MQVVIVEGGDQQHGRDAQNREHPLPHHEMVAVAVVVIRIGVARRKQHHDPDCKQHEDQKQHGHIEAEAEREELVTDAFAPPDLPRRRRGRLVIRNAHRRTARYALQPAGCGSSGLRHIGNRSFFSDFPPAGCGGLKSIVWTKKWDLHFYAPKQTSRTARMPATSVTPLNTKHTLFSFQPHISKWWWIGAILKIRLPWVSLK